MYLIWNNHTLMKTKKTYFIAALALVLFSGSILTSSLLAQSKKSDTFRVDFRDADIQDFLKSMSAIIGKNIIIDERVRGKITVISPRRLPRSQAYAYLTTVLSTKGFSVVDDGIVLRIIPIKDAVATSPDIYLGREPLPDEMIQNNKTITTIIPIFSNRPSRLAGILKRITGTTTDIIDYDEAATILITGNAREVNRLIRIVIEIDPESEDMPKFSSFQDVHIYHLENMQADKIEATLRKISMPPVDQTASGQSVVPGKPGQAPSVPRANLPQNQNMKIDVVGHKESNSLIFVGSKEEFAPIKDLIEQLDTPRDQVLLEVLIVEIIADDQNSFGIDWRIAGPNVATQFNNGIFASAANPDLLGINSLVGFSLGFLNNNGSVAGLLEANIGKKNFVIISAPQILTLDNQEAEIDIGQDVPVVTGNRLSGGGTAETSTFSYEYKPVGVNIKFTPQISQGGMVTLALNQEIKSVADTADVTQNPIFTKRKINTAVRVMNGQTIVIGGLVSTDKTQTERKIPVLGDIPILGFLFKRTSTDIKKTNLLVFITPHILSNRTLADQATEEAQKNQIQQFERLNMEN